MTRYMTSSLLLLILVTAPALATQDAFSAKPQAPAPVEDPDHEPRALRGQVAIGFVANSGNTENSNLNVRLLLGYDTDTWRHTLNFIGQNASDRGNTTSERYQFVGKSDYAMDSDDYLFITATYETDRFAGFDHRTSQAVGYGRELLAMERHQLQGEVGIGARQSTLADGSSESDGILRLAANYNWSISETTDFTQRLVVMAGGNNTYSESVTALNTRLVGTIHSIISFTVKHNDTVLPGREKTDTYTSVQLGYRF